MKDPAPFVALGQVLSLFRIAEGHVWPLIDQLAGDIGGGDLPTATVDQAESSARNGNPHRAAFLHRPFRRQIAHSCGGLALAIHHHEPSALRPGILGKLFVQRRGQLAPRLGHSPQGGQVHPLKAHPVQHFVGVRYAPEGSGPSLLEKGPKLPLHQGFFRHQQGPARQKVAVDDRQSVGIAHGQGGNGPLGLVQLQVGRNGCRIRFHILIALPDELRAPGGAGGGQQKGQFRMKRILGFAAGPQQTVSNRPVKRRHVRESVQHILRRPQEGRLIGLQQSRQGLTVHTAAQQKGNASVIDQPRISNQCARLIPAQDENQTAPAHSIPDTPPLLSQRTVGQRYPVFVQYCGVITVFL